MARHPAASDSVLRRVRTWFELSLADLSLYLGVSQSLLQAIEAGQRGLTLPVRVALLPLRLQLPRPRCRLLRPPTPRCPRLRPRPTQPT
ncbi:helix-turn-helix domain-containing protein [Hymenobacter cellulosilyticus]|uniref:Helix-turn-helix transcriptional regulator n=1 Tax=Hymenobacter cellulosilyticus TaxID=2932248 RepID=A0A8T9Q6R4_9BACT|nr:helix-turn-helix transcriptional regulator [Hymenobacter cellulosilyticus]UOQ71460.1 helix-turn-helix transcriptional regulator [Hymenobacter cellulosilyticus]